MLTKAFKHLSRKLRGPEPPKQKGILSFDLAPMNAAFRDGDLKELRRFLDKYELSQILSVTCNINTGATWLHAAAHRGDKAVMGLLLDGGADLQEQDNEGATPLHIAARSGSKDMVSFLLERGANIAAVDRQGWQPLAYAADRGHLHAAEVLVRKGAKAQAVNLAGQTALHKALGHLATMKLLIDHGADVDAADAWAQTPLHWTASSAKLDNRENSAAVLLLHGARIDRPDDKGKTPKAVADGNGFTALSALLAQEEAQRKENQWKLGADMKVKRIRLSAGGRKS